MSLAAIPKEKLLVWLEEAQAARHKLMIGRAATATAFDGSSSQSVTFQPTSLPKLENWIARLEAALGMSASTKRRALAPRVNG